MGIENPPDPGGAKGWESHLGYPEGYQLGDGPRNNGQSLERNGSAKGNRLLVWG